MQIVPLQSIPTHFLFLEKSLNPQRQSSEYLHLICLEPSKQFLHSEAKKIC
jgi:hypothetical protein